VDATRKAQQVRREILGQHAELRERLDELVSLADAFERRQREAGGRLRERGLDFYARFRAHMDHEEEALVPVLRASGEAGGRAADHLLHEHEEQRELLRYLLARLEKRPDPTLLVARELRNFVEYVRLDMAHEETDLLAPELLRGAAADQERDPGSGLRDGAGDPAKRRPG
jgi:hemerythrin-like domain-containing protein